MLWRRGLTWSAVTAAQTGGGTGDDETKRRGDDDANIVAGRSVNLWPVVWVCFVGASRGRDLILTEWVQWALGLVTGIELYYRCLLANSHWEWFFTHYLVEGHLIITLSQGKFLSRWLSPCAWDHLEPQRVFPPRGTDYRTGCFFPEKPLSFQRDRPLTFRNTIIDRTNTNINTPRRFSI